MHPVPLSCVSVAYLPWYAPCTTDVFPWLICGLTPSSLGKQVLVFTSGQDIQQNSVILPMGCKMTGFGGGWWEQPQSWGKGTEAGWMDGRSESRSAASEIRFSWAGNGETGMGKRL